MSDSSVHQIAERIAADLAGEDSGPGTQFGTEPELCARYGVSPAIFRQAARLLEASGIAVMRPGNRGGLIANGPALDGVARTISAYFQFTAVPLPDAIAVSWALMLLLGRLATERMQVGDVDRIRESIAALERSNELFESGLRRTDIFHQIALTTGNPILTLLSRVTLNFLVDVIQFEQITAATPTVVVQPSEIAEAIIQGDPDRVAGLIFDFRTMHEEIFGTNLTNINLVARYSSEVADGSDRTRSARVARRILSEIRQSSWPVGARIGDEPELMGRYGVSRATFRQAIRMLEQYSAVETRRGKRGGLFVTAPNPIRVVQISVAALHSGGASRADNREVMTTLLLLALELAVARETSEESKSLAQDIARICEVAPDHPLSAVNDLQRRLVSAAGNPVLAFACQLIEAFESSLAPETRMKTAAPSLLDDFAASYERGDLGRARRALIDISRI